jgi:hypothetical protein
MKTWTARGASALAAAALVIGGAACEPAPSLPSATIADSAVTEGTGGVNNLWFSLRLSAPSTQVVRLAWQAFNGTAVAPGDYAASQGTVEFTPGTTAAAVHVPLVTDDVDEVDETLRVVLSPSSTATVADDTGVGTIVDDDGAPTITLDDAPSGAETAGTSAGFPVRLSHASSVPVVVSCTTVDGTAKAGRDFPAQPTCGGHVPPGALRADIHIPRTDDNIDEDDESYGLRLTAATGGTIVDANATTTIFDNDAAPTFTIDDVDIPEGNPGDSSFARFTGRLSHPSSRTVVVRCQTRSGTAKQGDDFVGMTGDCFSFPFENTTSVNPVPIWVDTKKESDEDFFLDILGPGTTSAPVLIGDNQARAILRNDGDTCILFCS